MKPILFNSEMVQAILEGRKTATRRVVKPQPPKTAHVAKVRYSWCWSWWEDSDSHQIKPPYRPGDILYVREKWCSAYDGEKYFYFADKCTPREERKLLDYDNIRWHPSIHMPREAARLFLRVNDVWVERLHEITIPGMRAEGVTQQMLPGYCSCAWKTEDCMHEPCSNRDAYEYGCWMRPFIGMWDSTIKTADRALYAWRANPWVWVIEFERINREEVGLC